MKKKTKLNWRNISKVIVFVICLGFVMYDFYMLMIYPIFTGQLVGWTMIGFISFVAALFMLVSIYEDFKEETKNVSNTGNVKHKTK